MTQDNTQMVELLPVIQADRDRAADYLIAAYPEAIRDRRVQRVREGGADDDPAVQSHAAHRIAHTPEPATGPAHAKEQAAGVERCWSCDGTGDLIRLDGEYMGPCPCGAALTAPSSSVPDSAPATALVEALEAVADAMLQGGDGEQGDFGWNITKLNRARPLIRQALATLSQDHTS